MTYIELINRFWDLDEGWQFSCCETRLYFYLLKTANRLSWENNWTRSDTKVSSDVGVSVNVMKTARNRLVQSGLIEFKQGNGRGCKAVYSIKGIDKGMRNMTPLSQPFHEPLVHPFHEPLSQPFKESPPIPPKELNKTKKKKETPKGVKKESYIPELFHTEESFSGKMKPKVGSIFPTLEEVKSYFSMQESAKQLPDLNVQAEIFFNHFDSLGWKNSNGVKIERWQSKANLWIFDKITENVKKYGTNSQEQNKDSERQRIDVARNLERLDKEWKEKHGDK